MNLNKTFTEFLQNSFQGRWDSFLTGLWYSMVYLIYGNMCCILKAVYVYLLYVSEAKKFCTLIRSNPVLLLVEILWFAGSQPIVGKESCSTCGPSWPCASLFAYLFPVQLSVLAWAPHQTSYTWIEICLKISILMDNMQWFGVSLKGQLKLYNVLSRVSSSKFI